MKINKKYNTNCSKPEAIKLEKILDPFWNPWKELFLILIAHQSKEKDQQSQINPSNCRRNNHQS